MPRLKNSRRQTKRSKQRGKQKLVVAMVSKTSLRSQRKQSALKEAEKDDQSENEAKSLRPKRGKPVKRLIEEESPKIASNKRKATKKAASKGKKKPVRKIQPKATKRKGIKSEAGPAKRPKVQEDVEEMGAEFDELDDYDEMDDNAEEMLVITTKARQSAKSQTKSKAKKKPSSQSSRSQPAQIIIEKAPDDLHHHESDDDDDAPEEDDDDIDDSLFFGIPTEKSPEIGTCTHCKKKFHRDELPAHIASCPERYVQCRECNKVLSNLQTLERHHKRFHLKLREVPCTLCDKMFIDEAASRKHLKTVHFKVKNFHCPHCDKSFSQRNKLTYHVRTHSGEKPFSCPECGRAFSLLWNLKTHLRTHTGEKPYSCETCGRKFTQKQNMTSHMTTHKKPKLSRSNSYVAFSSAENLDYFSISDLRQGGKSSMVQSSDGSIKLHQGRLSQAGHYLIDQIGNITASGSDGSASTGIAVTQGNDPENGLGLLSSVARKGDNTQEYGSANVEVDGIVDETHLAQHIANNPSIDQVVEVLVQPQGGHGDATIALATTEVASVGHEGYISTSRVGGVIDTSDAFQSKESSVVTASAASLQQQQQVMNAQNVIPIGNANLSGLANILQNPEVLAAINAAAASNKFIVIGPVGMLSNSNTGTTNTVSLASAYQAGANLGTASAENDISVSEAVHSASNAMVGSHSAIVQMQGSIDSGVAGPCNVEMIAADTSQDSSAAAIVEHSSEAVGNEVQSSVSSVLVQSSAANSNQDAEGVEYSVVTSEEAQVVSSQDTEMHNVMGHHQNLDGEVSSSAGSNRSAKTSVLDAAEAEVGHVQSTNVTGMQNNQLDHVISGGGVAGTEAGLYYTVQQSSDSSSVQPSGQFVVTMKEQFVSSTNCTSSLSSETFIASNAMTGNGQSMVMVTADGHSYLTTMSVPEGLGQSDTQQIVLAPAEANNLSLEGAVASSVNVNSNEASCVLLTAHIHENPSESDVTPGQSADTSVPQGVDLGDFTVTDSTTRAFANSSNVTGSALNYVASAESESSIEVSGSNNLQADSMQSKIASTIPSDSTVDSQVDQADSIIESSQVFMLASAVEESPNSYSNAATGSGYEAQQSAFVDASNLLAASSGDSVVSGTENFVSSDLQKSEQLDMQRTGVTSSRDLAESTAESTTLSGNVTPNDNNGSDQSDSQVSTSLQI